MSAVNNPWNGISWSQTVAQCDIDYFNKKFGSPEQYVKEINARYPKAKLSIDDCLPEPFSGDINSKVYCLNMNPGVRVTDFCQQSDTRLVYQDQITDVLCNHKNHLFDNLMFDGKVIYSSKTDFNSFFRSKEKMKEYKRQNKEGNVTITPRPHAGAIWQRELLLNPLKKLLGRDPNLFIIEFFPYHSAGGFDFPKDLPSYQYRNQLIENAMRDHKLIIIMRQEKQWYCIKDNRLGQKIQKYPNKILLRGSQRPWISPGNFCRDVNLFVNPIPDWAYKTLDEVLNFF